MLQLSVLRSVSDNGREFSGSIFHKVKPDLEGAISLAWNSSNNVTQFGIGGKYNLDSDANIRAKVNSRLQLGLGYQQKLREGKICFCLKASKSNARRTLLFFTTHSLSILLGVTVTLSTHIDGKNFGSGEHKIGVALNLEA